MSEHPLSEGKPLSSTSSGSDSRPQKSLEPRTNRASNRSKRQKAVGDKPASADDEPPPRNRTRRRSPRSTAKKQSDEPTSLARKGTSTSSSASESPEPGTSNKSSGSKRAKSGTRRKRTSSRSRASRAEGAEPDSSAPSKETTLQASEGTTETAPSSRSRGRSRRGRSRREGEGRPPEAGAGAAESETVGAESDGEASPGTSTKTGSRRPRKKAAKRASRKTAAKLSKKTRAKNSERAPDGDGREAKEREDGSVELGHEADGDARSKPKRRKRGSRGGRRRRRESTGDSTEVAVEIEAIPGEFDDFPPLQELPPQTEVVDSEAGRGGRESRRRKAKKTKTKSKSAAERRAEHEAEEVVPKTRKIIVNAADPEETRVAVVEDGRITDLQMSVKKHVSYVSDIYRGRVVNLESAIGAAFVDFGQGRNGFLHASDVLTSYGDPDWSLEKLLSTPTDGVDEHFDEGKSASSEESSDDEEAPAPKGRRTKRSKRGHSHKGRSKRVRLPVEKLLKKGQMVCVQITKDAIGDKGPTLTTYISIPGRYLVLMPSLERTGVSRKIEDERERRRLKRILSSLKIPEGMGVIVRTAGVGRTKTELRRDLEYLLLAWDDFSKRLVSGRNPMPLYQESDVAIRTMRDLFSAETTESVNVDDEVVFQRMVEFTQKLMPEHVDRILRHEGPRPIFHTYGVEQDFEKIFARRVELPSGGSIVIEQTEALVAIDVNSGRTREAGAEFEDIALKTNLEAVPEIALQIRLRDLGGIIVLDYIDMMRSGSRRAVERLTRDSLRDDRARSKIGRISQFGLLELTRQRLGPGLNKLVYDTCIRCRGSGRRRNSASRAQAILRRLGASLTLKGFSTVEVRAHPEVVDYLDTELNHEMTRLEEKSGRKLVLMAAPEQVEDSVLHYLRADGREVRPGGRRKK